MGTSLKNLKALFAEKYDLLPVCRVAGDENRFKVTPGSKEFAPAGGYREECRLFRETMADVRPLRGRRRLKRSAGPTPPPETASSESGDVERLHRLIAHGEGFVVDQTPEYMEGAGRGVPQSILRRLHRGDFSIQGHIDMHGLTAEGARFVFDRFLNEAVASGKQAVLIIHGRGLSSPRAPVLKRLVAAWLSAGPWRRWVIAFASARACDGGTGATYVLLRRRPASRRASL